MALAPNARYISPFSSGLSAVNARPAPSVAALKRPCTMALFFTARYRPIASARAYPYTAARICTPLAPTINPAAVAPIEPSPATIPSCAFTQPDAAAAIDDMPFMAVVNAGKKTLPTDMPSPSMADFSWMSAPFALFIMVSAIFWASPSQFSI